jgi:hypothetical protein
LVISDNVPTVVTVANVCDDARATVALRLENDDCVTVALRLEADA